MRDIGWGQIDVNESHPMGLYELFFRIWAFHLPLTSKMSKLEKIVRKGQLGGEKLTLTKVKPSTLKCFLWRILKQKGSSSTCLYQMKEIPSKEVRELF